jgi:hypothetical protein
MAWPAVLCNPGQLRPAGRQGQGMAAETAGEAPGSGKAIEIEGEHSGRKTAEKPSESKSRLCAAAGDDLRWSKEVYHKPCQDPAEVSEMARSERSQNLTRFVQAMKARDPIATFFDFFDEISEITGPEIGPAISLLVEALRDSDFDVQVFAVMCIAPYGKSASACIPNLIAYFDNARHMNPDIRWLVIGTLSSIGHQDERVIAFLTSVALDENDELVRGRAGNVLKDMDLPKDAIDKLVDNVYDTNLSLFERARALEILGIIAEDGSKTIGASSMVRLSATEWDSEASARLPQLKLFYLVFRAYTEGEASLRKACQTLSGKHYLKLEADGLPKSVPSFSRNIKQLNPLFAKILADAQFSLFTIEKWADRKGDSIKFRDDASKAWVWTDKFLRRQKSISPAWFGFSSLTPSANDRASGE